MRSIIAALLGGSVLIAGAAPAQQSGPANLCQELLAFAEKKASEPPKPAAAPSSGAMRPDNQSSGTQGGGTTNPSSSSNTSSQGAAPPTSPVSSGAAAEPATSPHATDQGSSDPVGPMLAGGVTLQQVKDAASSGNHQACREAAQKIRRSGGDMPAALIALAAYEAPPAR